MKSEQGFLEASHKVNPREWLTIDMDNYKFSCNGQEKFTADQVIEQGTYNVLIGQTNYYDSRQISFEESHAVFKKSFSQGFAWEVLEVYSPPPTVTFKWRHFGLMMNEFSCRGLSGHVYRVDPTKKMVEIFGMCKATVNDRLQIQDLQIFYDPNQLFAQLTEISPFAPFESFANPTAKVKPNSLAPMPSPSSNTNLAAASSAKLRSESNLKKTIDEQELKSISFERNPSSKFCVLS